MPLLYRKPFEPNPIPSGLKETDEVYYCDVTNEVFDNYSDFSERIILCNSLVWACSITHKSNLTYQEALESEKHSRALLNEFPVELRVPVLYLVSLTCRSSFTELSEDVYTYVRERFFVGETVDVNIDGDIWVTCHILQVTSPDAKELQERKHLFKQQAGKRVYWPPADCFKYEVESMEDEEDEEGDGQLEPKVFHVSGQNIRRKKAFYSRMKNQVFIKNFIRQIDGIWMLKEDAYKKFNISKVIFDRFFSGPPPKFPKSDPSKKKLKKIKGQESIEKYIRRSSPLKEQQDKNVSAAERERMEAQKRNSIAQRELMEKRRKEEALEREMLEKKRREDAKNKKREEKRKLAEFTKRFNRIREDLELDDLKPLPTPTSIVLPNLPNKHFGRFAGLYEFFVSFKDIIRLKQYFNAGLTISLLNRALTTVEVAGPLSDIIFMLLGTIFKLQNEEDDEIEDDVLKNLPEDGANVIEFKEEEDQEAAVEHATVAARWSQIYQGVPMEKLTMNATTVTEILRLHLLASGGRCGEQSSKWRYQERGGYCSADDPAFVMRMRQPNIMHALQTLPHVCYLPLEDKLTILETLRDQILTFATTRDLIDEAIEKNKQTRVELRTAMFTEQKKEKELAIKMKEYVEKRQSANPVAKREIDLEMEKCKKMEGTITRKKEELSRKISEFEADIGLGNQLIAVGMDRAFRRYWIFNSLPGLFVEDDELQCGSCLTNGTPDPNEVLLAEQDTSGYVERLFREEYNKENIGSKLSPGKSPAKRLLVTPSKRGTRRLPLTCWSDSKCPIHSAEKYNDATRVRWSYYRNEEEINQLMNRLNHRGRREAHLRNVLNNEKDRILKNIARPFVSLNPLSDGEMEAYEEACKGSKKASSRSGLYDKPMFDFPPDTPVSEVLETLVRNMIVEMEEKIHGGGLGSLKVNNRTDWINSLVSNCYDSQVGQLELRSTFTNGKSSNLSKNSVNSHIPDTNDVKNEAVTKLAKAILQLEQSLKLPFLKKPLISEGKDVTDNDKIAILRRWETSLLACRTYSQLFLHLGTLNSSIGWRRLGAFANCRICRGGNDPESILLCDNCNRGHHLSCLKPKLSRVPKGDWFCDDCRPQMKDQKNSSSQKEGRKRKAGSTSNAVSNQETPDNSDDDHPADSKSTKLTNGFLEKMKPSEGICKVCKTRGLTLRCRKCSKHYHMECVEPPLRKIPLASWTCRACRHSSLENENLFNCNTVSEHHQVEDDGIRFSRRKTSLAASKKISRFAKQMRVNNLSDYDSEDEVESDSTVVNDVEDSDEVSNGRASYTRNATTTKKNSLSSRQNALPLDNAGLQELLDKVLRHNDSWPFRKPVTKAEAPDYHDFVKRPMDFATIKNKLNTMHYATDSQLINDALLVFSNCYLYNQPDSEVYQAGKRLESVFKKTCRQLNFSEQLLDLEERTLSDEPHRPPPKKLKNGDIEAMLNESDSE